MFDSKSSLLSPRNKYTPKYLIKKEYKEIKVSDSYTNNYSDFNESFSINTNNFTQKNNSELK